MVPYGREYLTQGALMLDALAPPYHLIHFLIRTNYTLNKTIHITKERMLQQIQETDQKMEEEKQSGTKQAETKKIRRIWWQAMNKTFQDNIKVEEDQKDRHAD
eukprot:1014159_1